MSRRRLLPLFYLVLAALYVLHNDLWLWNDGRIWHGLPAGLLYHVGFCIAVSATLALMAALAWPPRRDGEEPEPAPAPGASAGAPRTPAGPPAAAPPPAGAGGRP